MPLSKYVTNDKSKMISFVTTKANSAPKRSVQLQIGNTVGYTAQVLLALTNYSR